MGIRDEEIKRLELYAKGLGIKVNWLPYVKGSGVGAEWLEDGSEITVYYRKKESKTNQIFKLIHELGHHLDWVYSGRKQDLKTNKALDKEAEGDYLSKDERKLIYESEKNGAAYREAIYNEVGIKIPKYLFKADIDLDMYIYRTYYLTGYFPTYENIKLKKRELIQKYKMGG